MSLRRTPLNSLPRSLMPSRTVALARERSPPPLSFSLYFCFSFSLLFSSLYLLSLFLYIPTRSSFSFSFSSYFVTKSTASLILILRPNLLVKRDAPKASLAFRFGRNFRRWALSLSLSRIRRSGFTPSIIVNSFKASSPYFYYADTPEIPPSYLVDLHRQNTLKVKAKARTRKSKFVNRNIITRDIK